MLIFIAERLKYGKNIYFDASLILVPLMLGLSIFRNPVKNTLETHLFQVIGKLSLSIYFWHPIARAIMRAMNLDNTFIGLIVYMLLTFAIAYFSYRFIEKKPPIIRYKV